MKIRSGFVSNSSSSSFIIGYNKNFIDLNKFFSNSISCFANEGSFKEIQNKEEFIQKFMEEKINDIEECWERGSERYNFEIEKLNEIINVLSKFEYIIKGSIDNDSYDVLTLLKMFAKKYSNNLYISSEE